MYLKRVEMFGFKSFAEKTVLELGPGITAVVGPNGAGKSNVSDAIRWVLGESSARQLRGVRMEDIIFGGSDSRRPLGYAQVSITLDNADGLLPVDAAEVMVSRRVDRAGDSEYFINQVQCRQKDVVDLFMDTGVGRDTYALVGQGKVDEILSSRPEDRRALFEEAAGIVRYKTRKKEAQRRLTETEQNLERLGDVMTELQGQIESLAGEAAAARQYQQLHAEWVDLEIALLATRLAGVQGQAQTQDAANRQHRQQLADLEQSLSAAEESLEAARQLAGALELEAESKQRQLLEITSALQQAEAEAALARQREENAAVEEQRLSAEAADLTGRHTAAEEQYRTAGRQRASLAAELTEARAQLEAAQAGHGAAEAEVAAAEETLETEKDQVVALLQEAARLRSAAEAARRAAEEAGRRQDRVGAGRQALEDELAAQTAALAAERQALADGRAEQTAARAQLDAARTARAGALDRAAQIDQEAAQLRGRLQGARGRLDVLQEMQREFEGFQKGPRAVLQARAQGRDFAAGIVGAVAELIRTERRYERALEVALGGAIQDIVTTSDQAAKAAIAFLKERRAGRATFLPLNTIRARGLPAAEAEELGQRPGVLGIAADLVECEPQVRPAIVHLLGRVPVTADLDAALALGRATGFRYKIVTLEGELVHPGGALTGGAAGSERGGGLLARERERQELSRQVEELAGALKELEARSRAERAAADRLEQDLAAQSEKLEELGLHLARRQSEVGRLEGEQDRLQQALAALEQQVADTRAEADAALAEAERLVGQEAELQRRRAAAEAAVARLQDDLRRRQGHREGVARDLADLRIRVVTLEQEEKSCAAEEQRLAGTLAELAAALGRNKAAQERVEQARAETQQALAQAEEAARAAQQQRQALDEEGRGLQARRLEVQGAANQREREIRQGRRTGTQIQEALAQGEAAAARLQVEEEHLCERLHQEFAATPESVRDRVLDTAAVASARARAADLKAEKEALGPVNLGAIEAHQKALERQRFFAEQRADLEEAKTALYRAIDELDRRIRTRFKESFEQVRQVFKEVFRSIFDGGRADLVLVDEDNLLETGVEILAQPPGKKLQSLELLSGGERAMTAIALLFAFLKVRPSPFVVLDEVEAALDEANVERFGRFLAEFAREIQFIVITHQRGTMEVADALYGVTMEGTGVSRLVSVRLGDLSRQHA